LNCTGSQLVIEALKKEGVDTVFGYPGGVVIPLFDALYHEPAIRVVLTRHEQGAIHAADGYARATGKTGVCIVTSGPGATNAVTGLATANFDSVPIVCISGQVPRKMIGNDAFQEADTVGITRPVTKHNYIILEREELPLRLKESFFLARSGRPGPILIDIPKDIFTSQGSGDYPEEVSILGYNPVTRGHRGQIKRAADAINEAQRPLLFMGGGVNIADAGKEMLQLAETTGIPVISSLMGIGGIPGEHPQYLGMLGMHGTYAANMAVTNSDLLVGIGVRFDDRATGELDRFAPGAKIIHIDIDPAAIARNVPVEIPIVGDARQILEELVPLCVKADIAPWKEQIRIWQEEHPLTAGPEAPRLSPARVIQRIAHHFPDSVICTEVGQNQMWTALFYKFRRTRSWITSGGLGTMGYGFPASIGAQIALPGTRVIDIAGDGSFQMNSQELATAVQEKLPVIVAILNNGYLGMVRQWQELFYGGRYSSTDLMPGRDTVPSPPGNPDFVKLAEAYGAVGLRAGTMEEVEKVLEQAAGVTDRPVLIDFQINYEANVWPMVPPGAGLSEMLFQEETNE